MLEDQNRCLNYREASVLSLNIQSDQINKMNILNPLPVNRFGSLLTILQADGFKMFFLTVGHNTVQG